MANKKPFPFEVCKQCCSGANVDITIDKAMSDESENTVQNKVIKAYVDESIQAAILDSWEVAV